MEVNRLKEVIEVQKKLYSLFMENKGKSKYRNKIMELSLIRGIPQEHLQKYGIIFYDGFGLSNEEKKLLGFLDKDNRDIPWNRWIIPFSNTIGLISGWVGYSHERKQKYVYSTNLGFKHRNMLYENTMQPEEVETIVLVEGIFDRINLERFITKEDKIKVSAINSTRLTNIQKENVKRYKNIIIIPDENDTERLFEKSIRGMEYKKIILPSIDKNSSNYVKDVDDYINLNDYNGYKIKEEINKLINSLEKEVRLVI